MSRRALVPGGVAVGLAIVAGGVAGHAAPAAVGGAIAVASIVALLVVRELAGRVVAPATTTAAGRDRPELGSLRALDRAVDTAIGSQAAFDRELRPLVRSIATTRLARRGIDADLSPAAAEAILGQELWDWIRGGPAGSTPTWSRAAAAARLQGVLDRLERI